MTHGKVYVQLSNRLDELVNTLEVTTDERERAKILDEMVEVECDLNDMAGMDADR